MMTDLVLSDVHLELNGACRGLAHVTTFGLLCVPLGSSTVSDTVDEDGDLEVTRRAHGNVPTGLRQLSIAHRGATALADVGMQVWRGECLLVDWILEAAASGTLAPTRTVLELGGGTGLATVVAGHALASSPTPAVAKRGTNGPAVGSEGVVISSSRGSSPVCIFCTDHHVPSLEAARQNLASNMHLFHRGPAVDGGGMRPVVELSYCSVAALGPTLAESGLECHFRQLDWMDFAPYISPSSSASVAAGSSGPSPSRARQFVEALVQDEGDRMVSAVMPMGFGASGGSQLIKKGNARGDFFKWGPRDLERLEELDLIIAGDVVYEETLTEALICCAAALLRYPVEARQARACGSPQSPSPHPPPRMILAVEKRWCFTLRDLDSRAPAFDHLISLIDIVDADERAEEAVPGGASRDKEEDGDGWECWGRGRRAGVSSGAGQGGSDPPPKKLLKGRRIDVATIPQRLVGYNRGPDLELWELCLAD